MNWSSFIYRFLNGVHVKLITTTTTTTAIEFRFGGISPYTSTDKTNTNKYT